MRPVLILYAGAALVVLFLVAFAMVGETLRWRAVRRWQFAAALALALAAWLASAWLR